MSRGLPLVLLLTVCSCAREPETTPSTGAALEGNTTSGITLEDLDPASGSLDPSPLGWRWNEQHSIAVLELRGGPAIFSIRCDKGSNALLFLHRGPAPHEGRSTLSLTAGRHAASLAASAIEVRPGDTSYWLARESGSRLHSSVARTLKEPDTLRISIGGAEPLQVAHSDVPIRALDACGVGTKA